MPKFNVTAALTLLDGAPLSEGGKPVTLRKIICDGLLAPRNDLQEEGNKKAQLYELALRVQRDDTCKLRAEDIVLVKERVAHLYPPLIVGQVFRLLDDQETAPVPAANGDDEKKEETMTNVAA